MYTFVSGSIPEIRANAEAALILQCDPDGRLEEDGDAVALHSALLPDHLLKLRKRIVCSDVEVSSMI